MWRFAGLQQRRERTVGVSSARAGTVPRKWGVTSWIYYMFAAVGSFTAGTVLTAPDVDTYPLYDAFGFEPVPASDIAASAAGAVVAGLVALGIRHRIGAIAGAMTGTVLVAAVALPGAWRYDLFVSAIGAGVLLGALVVFCSGAQRYSLHSVMAGGTVAALLTAEPIAEYRAFADAPSSSAFYQAVSAQSTNTVWLVLAAIVAVTAVLIVALRAAGPGSIAEPPRSFKEAVVGIAVPLFVFLSACALHAAIRSPDSESFGQRRWLWGILVVPLVIGVALLLHGRRGTVLLAALAVAVTAATAPSWIPDEWLLVPIPILLAAAGVWCARRAPRPIAGTSVLALVAATSILTRAPEDNIHFVATLVVLPAAAAYTICAALPSTASVTTTSFSLPAVMSLPLVIRFGWTSYTPLTTTPDGVLPDPWTVTVTGVSVAAVIAAGTTMWWLRRRTPDASSAF